MDTPPAIPARPPPARGRPPVVLSAAQKAELIELVTNGKGVDLALRSVGGTYRGYRNACRDDADFRLEVASARRAADQTLDYIGYLAAFDVATEGGREVLFKLWDRRNRALYLNIARRDRSRERREDRQDRSRERRKARAERRLDRALKLHQIELAAAVMTARAAGPPATDAAGRAEPPLDLSRLTVPELNMFRALVAKMMGEPIPAEPGTIDV